MKAGRAALLSICLACVSSQGGWDVASLEAAHPELQARRGQRLGDAPPYWLPSPTRDELVLFLCRWQRESPIRVSLPPDASEAESAVLQRALDAWQAAGLGIRFETVASARADIEIRFAPVPEEPVLTGAGDTIADCAFDALPQPRATSRVAARMVFASVLLQRVLFDVAGRASPLSADELLAATLHELGHALGYPGHARSRDSIMTTATGEVQRIARRVAQGEALDAPTLAALYSLPSGIVVGRLPVPAARLDAFTAFEQRARAAGLQGPFVRVGGAWARLLWRSPNGAAAGSLVVRDWPAVLRAPQRFQLEPTALARALLAEPEAP